MRELRQGESDENRLLGEPLRSLAADAGLKMRRAGRTPFTRHAQAVTEYAKRSGREQVFHRRAYAAFWETGADLGDLRVLEALAVESGLDWDDIAPRLEAGGFDRALQDQHDEAMRLGLHGVPGFVVDGRFSFTGAQPIEFFRLAARRALEARTGGSATRFGRRVVGEM